MRRLCIIAAAIVVAAIGTTGVAQAATAQAATAQASPCSGYSCHGHDPVAWGCDKYQLTSTETDGALATVVNWYSTGCNANWAQAWLSPAAIAAGDKMTADIEAIDTQGNEEIMCYPGPGDTGNLMELCYDGGYYSGSAPAYTDMVDGTNLTYAAVYVWDSSGNNLLAEYKANQ
jgi:Protein of unknown function (DUF2690)